MIAVLKPIEVRPLKRPTYQRWDLVRQNDIDAWIRANREALQGWYNDCEQYTDDPGAEPFEEFAKTQFELERSHFEELRADAKLDHDYVDRED